MDIAFFAIIFFNPIVHVFKHPFFHRYCGNEIAIIPVLQYLLFTSINLNSINTLNRVKLMCYTKNNYLS
jgi:hypothetical protein